MTVPRALRHASLIFCLFSGLFGMPVLVQAEPTAAACAPLIFPRQMTIQLEDTHTFVGIAKVHLKIGQMTYDSGKIQGTYDLTVPLRKSKNEQGVMAFDLKVPVMSLVDHGGTILGEGISTIATEPARAITCILTPDTTTYGTGAALLVIDTGDRILHFKTRYTCLELAGFVVSTSASDQATVPNS